MAKGNKQDKITAWQKQALLGGICKKCGAYSSRLSVDHILPDWFCQSFDPTGELRLNDEENFELICYVCNHAKGGRIDKFHPKTKELILKYINL